jgi:hypothetical protein
MKKLPWTVSSNMWPKVTFNQQSYLKNKLLHLMRLMKARLSFEYLYQEPDEVLKELKELTVQSLKTKGYEALSEELAGWKETPDNHDAQRDAGDRKVSSRGLPIVLSFLLTAATTFIIFDQLVLKPRLVANFSRLVSFRDRVRPTSDLPVPTLGRARAVGKDGWTSFSSPLEFTITSAAVTPEQQYLLQLATIKQAPKTPEIIAPIGTTNTTTPRLEVSHDPNAYGFYIRNLQDDSIVYDNSFATGNTITLPDGVLKDGGVYQWNARTRNCHYWSEFSPAQVFTVNVNE